MSGGVSFGIVGMGELMQARFRHNLTETTRDMAKRGSEDLKKLAALQATLVSETCQTELELLR